MRHHSSRNYLVIRVMLWSFPYLLWQAFGHWSGFLVGVIVAATLTVMLNGLLRVGAASSAGQQPLQRSELQGQEEDRRDVEPYQRGYRAEEEPYRARPQSYQAGVLQPEYEEMQVLYPQETM
jgi:hypothetical protein